MVQYLLSRLSPERINLIKYQEKSAIDAAATSMCGEFDADYR